MPICSPKPQIMETEVMTNAQLVCGQFSCLIDGLLCDLELICEDIPEDEDDRPT